METEKKTPPEKRHQITPELSNLLKDTRRKAGLTQVVAAEKLGLFSKAVIRLEAGERKVTIAELARISELYGVPVETFTRVIEK